MVLGFCRCNQCGKEFFYWNTYFKCKECGGHEYTKTTWEEDLSREKRTGTDGSANATDIFSIDDISGS